MWTTVLTLLLQNTLPEILAFITAHQAAHPGTLPTPQAIIAGSPSLQIVQQGAEWLDQHHPIVVTVTGVPPAPVV
jgi:hypothetical protein